MGLRVGVFVLDGDVLAGSGNKLVQLVQQVDQITFRVARIKSQSLVL